MDLQHEGHEAFGLQATGAARAPALDLAGAGIDVHLVIAQRRTSRPRRHERQRRAAWRAIVRHVVDTQRGIRCLDARRQRIKAQRRRSGTRLVKTGIEPRVDVVAKRQDAAGQPRHRQEQRGQQPGVAVQPDPGLALAQPMPACGHQKSTLADNMYVRGAADVTIWYAGDESQ